MQISYFGHQSKNITWLKLKQLLSK